MRFHWVVPSSFLVLVISGCQELFGDFSVSDTVTPALGPRICDSREYRCNGALLERCRDDRTDWELSARCESSDQCNLNSESCRVCTPGEYGCFDAGLWQCTAAGTWDPVQTCASKELCSVSQDVGRTSGRCIPPVCAAGSFDCHGPQLLRCAEGSHRWEPVALCATPEVCRDTVNSADETTVRCLASECQPDEYSCEGSVLKRCNPARNGWDTVQDCGSAANCSVEKRACAACTSGDVECNRGELRECAGSGEWSQLAVCDAPALCDASNRECKPAECAARGLTRCVNESPLTELQECAADLTWRVVAACVSPSLCVAEERRCVPQGCRPGETRCVGDALQRCAPDLSGFVTASVCAAGTCNAESGSCGAVCTAGSYRCNDVHLEQCVDGRWQHLSRCLTRELCDPNPADPNCREPICGGHLGDQLCRNSDLYSCAGRNDWGSEDFCASQLRCNAGKPAPLQPVPADTIGYGPGACLQCIPGAFSCVGNELHRCQSDGLGSPKIADCPRGCTSDDSGARCNP
jgi:hypothetical protein